MLNNSKPPHDAPLNYHQGLARLHLEKFGVEPFITGITWNRLSLIEKGNIKAIESGQP
jgi:hypothetical protein